MFEMVLAVILGLFVPRPCGLPGPGNHRVSFALVVPESSGPKSWIRLVRKREPHAGEALSWDAITYHAAAQPLLPVSAV